MSREGSNEETAATIITTVNSVKTPEPAYPGHWPFPPRLDFQELKRRSHDDGYCGATPILHALYHEMQVFMENIKENEINELLGECERERRLYQGELTSLGGWISNFARWAAIQAIQEHQTKRDLEWTIRQERMRALSRKSAKMRKERKAAQMAEKAVAS
jgi:hypothetical protein